MSDSIQLDFKHYLNLECVQLYTLQFFCIRSPVHDPLEFTIRDRRRGVSESHLAGENGSFRQLSTEPGRPGSGLAAAAALVGLTKPKIPPPVPQEARERPNVFYCL